MNTCKTALRILKSRKMYLVIYLGFIGIMMFAISWQIMRGSMTGGDEVFHPDTARVAVIDRDGDADGISSALRSYLALDGEMVDLADDSEALQQAVASNYVDLIAIVPHGFASDYQKYLDGSSNDQPTVETVVSYTSGAGSLSQLEVNEFLSLTRTAYLGQAGKQQSMETAMRTALDTAKADAKTSKIAVVQSPSADTDNTKPAASAFAGTIKTGLYPLLLVMPICTFLVIGTFNDSEIRRRLYSSPTRLVSLQMQEMLTCATFGLVVCVGLHGGDIGLDGGRRSAVRRDYIHECGFDVRVAAGVHVDGNRLRFPSGVGWFLGNGGQCVRQRIRSAVHVHVGYGIPHRYDARTDDHDRQAAAGMVAVRVHRQRVRAWHGGRNRRGLWFLGIVGRLGGIVCSGVHLPWSGIGAYPSHTPVLGLPHHHAVGQVNPQVFRSIGRVPMERNIRLCRRLSIKSDGTGRNRTRLKA